MILAIILTLCVHLIAGQNDLDLQGKLLGSQWRFVQANFYKNAFAYHPSLGSELRAIDPVVYEINDIYTHFNIVPGLCGLGISFQSRVYPTKFITQKHSKKYGYQVYVTEFSNNGEYREQACFRPKRGEYKPGSSQSLITFESLWVPGTFLCHSYRPDKVSVHRNDGSSNFDKFSSWIYVLRKDSLKLGEWVLIKGYNNPQEGDKIIIYKETGTETTDSSSTTLTRQHSWNYNLEMGASGFGVSLKRMYSYSGVAGTEQSSSTTFTKYEKESKTTEFNMTPGVPFYLFQWHFYSLSEDGVYIDSFSNIYYSHNKPGSPPTPDKLLSEPYHDGKLYTVY